VPSARAADIISPQDAPHGSGRAYRGRFAPSPTGPLHFGSLVAAVASYCDARAAGGQWLVRIEDVDAPRTRPGAEADILATLERYGFTWDGPVVRQHERLPLYEGALARLICDGRAYPCRCTRRDLVSAPVGKIGERIYPGTCRNGLGGNATRVATAWRMRVDDAVVTYRDRLFGEDTQILGDDVGDFIVKRADGLIAYQLAVVVDDADQGITDVVRGADLASSTARQIFLQRQLGLPTPRYLHVPVAGIGGQKLSKQTHATALPAVPGATLMQAWRFLGQAQPHPDWRPADAGEFWLWAVSTWDPARLPKLAIIEAPATSRGERRRLV